MVLAYPVTLSFREPGLERAYAQFRVSRTLYLGDKVFIGVRLAIIATYFVIAKDVPTYKYAALDAASVALQGSIVYLLRDNVYVAWRDTTLLMFRLVYFFIAVRGIPYHLHSLPLNNTRRTALRVALLGSGSINNALLGLGMPQMLGTFHLVQALCVCSMAFLVNRPTCVVMLDLPSGPDFVSSAWLSISTRLQLISAYWVGLPVATGALEAQVPSSRQQCFMLLSFLHFWLGFMFPTAVWYILERHSRQHFLRLQSGQGRPELLLLRAEMEAPWHLMLLLWLLVALLVFTALWDLLYTFG